MQTYIRLCGCVCVIWNSFGVGKSHSCYLRKNYGSRGNSSSFFSRSLVRSSSRSGVFSIESMQNRHFHSESNVFDVRWNGFGCQHSFRSLFALSLHLLHFEWRVHHHFRLHVIFLSFCASVCACVFRFLSIYFSKGKPIDAPHTVPGYTHNHNISILFHSHLILSISNRNFLLE